MGQFGADLRLFQRNSDTIGAGFLWVDPTKSFGMLIEGYGGWGREFGN
jgi:hypothetical protein